MGKQPKKTKRRFRNMSIMSSMGITVLLLLKVVVPRICSSMATSLSDGVSCHPRHCSVLEVLTPVTWRLMIERTGKYVAHDDHIPISGVGDLFKDMLLGISIADFAIAIVDEAETEAHVFQHWTVTGSLEDDTPTPSYVTI